jgi:pantoate kinase
VKLRLNNWALWKEREGSGGLGFRTSSVIIEVVDQSGYRDSVIPVDDVDAGLTNSAVESLKLTRSHLYHTLQYIYPQGMGIAATARLMARAESTIKVQLEEADRALAAWFTDRQEKQQAAKINFELVRKNSFTT